MFSLSNARKQPFLLRSFSSKLKFQHHPNLAEFMAQITNKKEDVTIITSGSPVTKVEKGLRFYIETYGCQMNSSDSEIVRSILSTAGHETCSEITEADVILTNTCAIRENAEDKVWHRLNYFQSLRRKNKSKTVKSNYPIVGVLGCMAERLKDRMLLEESVDFVCGPDAYRDIPRLLENMVSVGQKEANTILSFEETYADISPVREVNSCSAFVSIMRGCNNMCSFCIVPFTRGRERSRAMSSILQEVKGLSEKGVKEVVLLGQNVNGYHDSSPESAELFPTSTYKATPGFDNLFKSRKRDTPGARFADLLQAVAEVDPEMRVRFTSPHPKDFPEEVLNMIQSHKNICASLHMPVQSGSTSVLKRMRRGYSREAFLELIDRVRSTLPGATISTDVIAGFCGETEEEHQDTVSLMKAVQFDSAFMFAYSLRDKTHAAHKMEDDVPEDVKQRRLKEIIAAYREKLLPKNHREELNMLRLVLIEGPATKSSPEKPLLTGRTDGNRRVVFPATPLIRLPAALLKDLSQSKEFTVPTTTTTTVNKPVDTAADGTVAAVTAPAGKHSSTVSVHQLLFDQQGVESLSDEEIQTFLADGIRYNVPTSTTAGNGTGTSADSEGAVVSGDNDSDTVEKAVIPVDASGFEYLQPEQAVGQYAIVRILKSGQTLRGCALAVSGVQEFEKIEAYLNGLNDGKSVEEK